MSISVLINGIQKVRNKSEMNVKNYQNLFQRNPQGICIFKWFTIFCLLMNYISFIRYVTNDRHKETKSSITDGLDLLLIMFFTMLLLSFQVFVIYSLEKVFKEELLTAERELSEFNERNHLRVDVTLPIPQFRFTAEHLNEAVTPPPTYELLTPPPTFEEVSNGFLFQPKTEI